MGEVGLAKHAKFADDSRQLAAVAVDAVEKAQKVLAKVPLAGVDRPAEDAERVCRGRREALECVKDEQVRRRRFEPTRLEAGLVGEREGVCRISRRARKGSASEAHFKQVTRVADNVKKEVPPGELGFARTADDNGERFREVVEKFDDERQDADAAPVL